MAPTFRCALTLVPLVSPPPLLLPAQMGGGLSTVVSTSAMTMLGCIFLRLSVKTNAKCYLTWDAALLLKQQLTRTLVQTLSPLSSYNRDEECNDSVVLTKSNRSVCGGHTSGPDTAGIPGCPNQETFLGNGYS